MRWFAPSLAKPASDGAAGGARLLDEALLAALRSLTLPQRRVRGALPGANAGTQPGRGEDFFQHRSYVRGEDVRAVDWRASARTGHLLVKERHRPLRQPLALLVDASASMDFPAAGPTKLRCALQLGAALAVLALRRGDPVSLLALTGHGFVQVARALPVGPAAPLAEGLFARMPRVARADVPLALSSLQPAPLAGAQAVLISDLYGDVALLAPALQRLVRAEADLTVLQVLAPGEQRLPAGAARVRDAETGEERALPQGEAALFAARVAAWRAEVRAAALGAGAAFLGVDAAAPPGATLRGWLG